MNGGQSEKQTQSCPARPRRATRRTLDLNTFTSTFHSDACCIDLQSRVLRIYYCLLFSAQSREPPMWSGMLTEVCSA